MSRLPGRCGKEPFLDLSVLGSVNDPIAHLNQGLQVVLDCFRLNEPPHPAKGFGQADSPDFCGNPGAFNAKERDQRGNAGVAFHLGQQRG
ncbi:MAG: hypothetical protein M3Z75_16210 [Actinomycetota bacterium]|nr:hypothetical protein [Actinomycetota bacterium]